MHIFPYGYILLLSADQYKQQEQKAAKEKQTAVIERFHWDWVQQIINIMILTVTICLPLKV